MRCIAGWSVFAVLPIAAVDDLPVFVGGMPYLRAVPSTAAPALDFIREDAYSAVPTILLPAGMFCLHKIKLAGGMMASWCSST
ncbi:MAG: hypothetical protein SPJ81_05770 [Lachnoclostridium sp.]|nr:hypothetical protein [Lachnoclostridium sp.]